MSEIHPDPDKTYICPKCGRYSYTWDARGKYWWCAYTSSCGHHDNENTIEYLMQEQIKVKDAKQGHDIEHIDYPHDEPKEYQAGCTVCPDCHRPFPPGVAHRCPQGQIKALEKMLKAKDEIIKQYACHWSDCQRLLCPDEPCTCGLEQALNDCNLIFYPQYCYDCTCSFVSQQQHATCWHCKSPNTINCFRERNQMQPSHYIESLKKFHAAFGLPIGSHPKLIRQSAFARRLRLMLEELSEYCDAVSRGDIVEIADALADMLYVVFGTAVEHGLPMDEIFSLVHKSNMTKIGGHKDPGGKWIKPSTYIPADLSFLRGVTSTESNGCQDDAVQEQ